MNPNLESADTNERPDVDPISIPDQDIAPTLDERLAHVEDILHI